MKSSGEIPGCWSTFSSIQRLPVTSVMGRTRRTSDTDISAGTRLRRIIGRQKGAGWRENSSKPDFLPLIPYIYLLTNYCFAPAALSSCLICCVFAGCPILPTAKGGVGVTLIPVEGKQFQRRFRAPHPLHLTS